MSAASTNDEYALTTARGVELRLDPVRGKFDSAHLIEIHRRLTQDVPQHRPGQFRPAVAGQHVKARELSTGLRYEVPYSPAREIPAELNRALNGRDLVNEFRGLDKQRFAEQMAKLYGDLDRTHAFTEANSRTLREFTAQLARESGHDLAWEKMVDTQHGRDLLYLARDREVFLRAYPGIDKPGFLPTDRHQAEAENISRNAGQAYPTMTELVQRLHQDRQHDKQHAPNDQQQQEIER